MLPKVNNLLSEDVKIEDVREPVSRIVDRWMEKKGRPNKIEELIQKLDVIKRTNQKRSIQRLPFILIQSLVAAKSK